MYMNNNIKVRDFHYQALVPTKCTVCNPVVTDGGNTREKTE